MFAQRAMAARRDSGDLLHSIDVPALVIAGRQDAIIPAAEVRAMSGEISGAQFVEMECGHLSNLEEPHGFNKALGAFLTPVGAVR